jgi:hypothetical protein
MQSALSLLVISWGSPLAFLSRDVIVTGLQAAKERERARVVGGSVPLLPSISPITHRNISRWLNVCSGHEVWFSYNSCHVLPTASFSCAFYLKYQTYKRNNFFICGVRHKIFSSPSLHVEIKTKKFPCLTDHESRAGRCRIFLMSMMFWLLGC